MVDGDQFEEEADASNGKHPIEMRDGKKLYTLVYTPKAEGEFPILLKRTPYGIHPYGKTKYPSRLGPSEPFVKDKYIFTSFEGRLSEMLPPCSVMNL